MSRRIESIVLATVLLLTTVSGLLFLNVGITSAAEVQQTLIAAKASSSIPNWLALNIFGYVPKIGANVISGTVKVLGIERSVNIGSYNTACSGQVTVFNERNFISPTGATYRSCYYQQ